MMNLSIAAFLFCVFLQSLLLNSNDTFTFGPEETGSVFFPPVVSQGQINGNGKERF